LAVFILNKTLNYLSKYIFSFEIEYVSELLCNLEARYEKKGGKDIFKVILLNFQN